MVAGSFLIEFFVFAERRSGQTYPRLSPSRSSSVERWRFRRSAIGCILMWLIRPRREGDRAKIDTGSVHTFEASFDSSMAYTDAIEYAGYGVAYDCGRFGGSGSDGEETLT